MALRIFILIYKNNIVEVLDKLYTILMHIYQHVHISLSFTLTADYIAVIFADKAN